MRLKITAVLTFLCMVLSLPANGQLRTKKTVYNKTKKTNKVVSSKKVNIKKPPIGIGLKAVPNEKVFKKTVTLPGQKNRQAISYVVRDNLAIFEGDIVLGNSRSVVDSRPKAHPKKRDFREFGRPNTSRRTDPLVSRINDRIIDRNYLWKHGIIPFKLGGGFTSSEVRAIVDAINELNRRTNLNIVRRNGQDHYIEFVKKPGMVGAGSSPVGRQRKPNKIKLNVNASRNTVIHEILHSAGIWHEQSRSDRDRFVRIQWNNIIKGVKHNFNKHSSNGYKVTPYDKNSIMHYGGFAFAKLDTSGNPLPTIVDVRTNNPVGGGSGLSAMDVDGINVLYPTDYEDFVTPPFTSIRYIKTRILRVVGFSRDGGIKKSGLDYYMRNEMGPGWNWRPGKKGNPTERFKSSTVERRDNYITPNWQFRYTIPKNEAHAKVWLKLKDDDGLRRNSRTDETVDINPFPGTKEVELYVDTQNGNIYLGDVDGARKDENYIGQVGEELYLQGFDRGHTAEIKFKIELD